MRPVTIIYIPYRDFKEKVRLVKKWKKKGYYVEDLGDGIYCMKTKGYKKGAKNEWRRKKAFRDYKKLWQGSRRFDKKGKGNYR